VFSNAISVLYVVVTELCRVKQDLDVLKSRIFLSSGIFKAPTALQFQFESLSCWQHCVHLRYAAEVTEMSAVCLSRKITTHEMHCQSGQYSGWYSDIWQLGNSCLDYISYRD
jgi:hypothetical protein